MSDIKLGALITGAAQRDAIHVAIAPVTSDEPLEPGMHVALVEGSATKVRACHEADDSIGIVDPFLRAAHIEPGTPFWLLLYPQTITSLRHEWTHPAFAAAEAAEEESPRDILGRHAPDMVKETATKWIERHAAELGMSFDQLMAYARNWATDTRYYQYVTQRGSESWRSTFRAEEFWTHFETLTGIRLVDDKRTNFFSCSC